MDNNSNYILPVPEGQICKLCRAWFFLALSALLMGGILPILIVLARAPIGESIPIERVYFKTAIVIHVNLTVLVWFLAFAGLFWTLNTTQQKLTVAWIAFTVCVAGMLIFTLAPFFGSLNPLMNNYIPVIDDPMFLVGLAICGAGFALLVIRELVYCQTIGSEINPSTVVRIGLYTSLLAAVGALFSLTATFLAMPDTYQDAAYYETLFWGSGHVLQFVHTQLLMIAWLWLANVSGISFPAKPQVALGLIIVGFLPILSVPFLYMAYEVGSGQHTLAFTHLMEYGGGLATYPMAMLIVIAAIASWKKISKFTAEGIALGFSIFIFSAGGIIGFLIRGVNVTIPAHYHGSIVGISLAFMGMAYYLLPRMGFKNPPALLSRIQPAIYGIGTFIHILGLAWSGGYGIQRKTAGADQGLDTLPEKISSWITSFGGGMAIFGGMLFGVVALISVWPRKSKNVE